VERVLLPEAREIEGLDEEIALLRVKLASALEEHPDNMPLVLRAVDMLVKTVAARYRLSKKSQDNLAKAEARGEAELREEEMAAWDGEVLVPTNCGQDLYDVIEINDGRAGLASVKRRVVGITMRYSTSGREARYEQKLRLGGV
jgi:hypothetical protein